MATHPSTIFKRCNICSSIAEYAELVGTNPDDVDNIYYCASHAENHMDQRELDTHRLDEFEALVKVTFEWPSGGKETRIPIGFDEEAEREHKSWEDFKRNYPQH